VATDDPIIISEMKLKYPMYDIVGNITTAQAANDRENRFKGESFEIDQIIK
jgi:hypothetical protein